VRSAVRNHGGGHANHSLLWQILTAPHQNRPAGQLAEMIKAGFGDYDNLVAKLSELTTNYFGSGWGWLVLDQDKKLQIYSTANQDSPLSTGHQPLLAIDVWEHAYYLKYQNKRADYVRPFGKS
jgi:Fe-Mn family superoxide dismutase